VKLPDGYVAEEVLSPGPTAVVTRARGPSGQGCVVKVAAIAQGLPAIEREAEVLRALATAGVDGVPRLVDAWAGGFAVELLTMPTLRQSGATLRQGETRHAAAGAAFERLAAVHSARDEAGAPLAVVHGDVSPDNLYLASDGSKVTLADFGLAHWRGGASVAGGAFRGTLLYVAPEVARGEPFDARADDFALAASLLHVATGVPLRDETTSPPVLLVDAGTRPLDASHPWRALARKLFDPAIAGALLACLAFDPRDRPRETPRPC
jgi:serine/threonine protein kinase